MSEKIRIMKLTATYRTLEAFSASTRYGNDENEACNDSSIIRSYCSSKSKQGNSGTLTIAKHTMQSHRAMSCISDRNTCFPVSAIGYTIGIGKELASGKWL